MQFSFSILDPTFSLTYSSIHYKNFKLSSVIELFTSKKIRASGAALIPICIFEYQGLSFNFKNIHHIRYMNISQVKIIDRNTNLIRYFCNFEIVAQNASTIFRFAI